MKQHEIDACRQLLARFVAAHDDGFTPISKDDVNRARELVRSNTRPDDSYPPLEIVSWDEEANPVDHKNIKTHLVVRFAGGQTFKATLDEEGEKEILRVGDEIFDRCWNNLTPAEQSKLLGRKAQ